MDWHLRGWVNLDLILDVWLPVAKHGRSSAVHVRQLDRVNSDANACLNLRQSLLSEVSLTEKTVILRCSQGRELKVPATRGSIYVEAGDWCQGLVNWCMNTKVLESSQARVHRHVILRRSLARHPNYLLQLLGRELCSLALNGGEGAHCRRDVLQLSLELGVKRLNTVLHRLVQLLETFVDLNTVI